MGWSLQQINGGGGPTVPNEYVACPDAPAGGNQFVCTFGNQQHFTYNDGNSNLQDCWYDGNTGQWDLQQINNATGQPTVPNEYVACPDAPATDIGGPFVCTFGNQQHFTYADVNGNLQDCWYDGKTGQWNLQQINGGTVTTVPGEYVAVAAAPATDQAAPFVCTFGNQQHFTYPDGNGNLQDCWYDGDTGQWNLQQINNATGQPTVPGEYVACPDAPVAARYGGTPFVCTFGNQQHFTYIDGNGNLQDCWWG